MSDVTAHDQFTRLARELSHNGAMITKLLATHPAEGHCTGCRLPGARVPIAAPCSVRALALLAAAIRTPEDQLNGREG